MSKRGQVHRQYTAEFKAAAVQRLREELVRGRSLSDVARALGITNGVLSRWRQEAEQREARSEGEPGESLEAELRRLRREVETLRQERDFAKKAAAYFAKELP
ncbi:transposase [Gemmatimonas sp.]|jgi:transposase|uniref:transposase n=1 Tax=Gemmatimonas sp. TaxID=1962908 RepID=UPI0037BFB26D